MAFALVEISGDISVDIITGFTYTIYLGSVKKLIKSI